MRMKDVYDRFVLETGVIMPKALFGELSVRYVLSKQRFSVVIRRGKVHNKRYSLQWRDETSLASRSARTSAPSFISRSLSVSPLSSRSQSPTASPTLSPFPSSTSSPVNSPPSTRRLHFEPFASEPFSSFSLSAESFLWSSELSSPKEKSHLSCLFTSATVSSPLMVAEC